MKRGWLSLTVALLLVAGLSGCDHGPSGGGSGQSRLNIYMTDSPSDLDAVNIVIREVSVHSEGQGWVVINDSLRTFDLLTLTNGASVLLGSAVLEAGHYTQIRLLLGEGSNVVVDGIVYPLVVPSGTQTGIKLIHEFTLEPSFTYELMLDFDASRSVNQTGNGTYHLKPTIRVTPVATSGAIAGFVAPASSKALVTATSLTDTASVYADTLSGLFNIIALPPSAYSLYIVPSDSIHKDTVLTNVQVTAGQVTSVGTITLELK